LEKFQMAISPLPVVRSTSVIFGFRVGFFGDGGSNGAISGSNKSQMAAAAIFDNFKWPFLCNGSYDPLI